MTRYQTPEQKQAEITYRKNLNQGGYEDAEPTKVELVQELRNRNNKTRLDFQELQRQDRDLSPFLEIGAERGQRAMLLSSEFGEQGIMLDLSYESLKQSREIKSTLKLNKIPQPISADAYKLPFKSNSFELVFIYQTLHHFPDPEPIIEEAYRVLKPKGVFFFNEEPVMQKFNLKLWRRPTKLRWWEKPLKWIGLLHFISEIGKSETDAGIIETSFDLPAWENALNKFKKVEATLTVFPFGPTAILKKSNSSNSGWLSSSGLVTTLLYLLGGNIHAICHK